MGEEITRILKLLEDGRINSDEAERLINAVSGKRPQGFYVPAPPKIPKELFMKMETIPEQVGKAVSAAFGSVGTSGGRRTFHEIDSVKVKLVSGNLSLSPTVGEVEMSGTGWPLRTFDEKGCLNIDAVNGDLEIKVKKGSSALINLVSADLKAADFDGAINIDSVSGDASVETCSGEWNIRSISGEISISDCEGLFSLATKSGDISIEEPVKGRFIARTLSGDVDVTVPSDRTVAISIDSGEGEVDIDQNLLSFVGAPFESAEITLEIATKNGQIKISQE